MVVLAKGELEQITLPAVQKAAAAVPPLADVPEVDLAAVAAGGGDGTAAAARAVVAACEGHGFFKVTGHGVPAVLMEGVEAAAAAFFALPQREKEAAAAAGGSGPFGYGSKRIGGNGDLGWVEYLLLGVTAAGAAPLSVPGEAAPPAPSCSFRDLLDEYIVAIRRVTCKVLELMAEGLGMEGNGVFARLVLDDESDSMLRVNHYPPHPELKHPGHGRLTGFGEHTDPQIISVLRSNDTSGLEISLSDGTWASVPPDRSSFFINVGDVLQSFAGWAQPAKLIPCLVTSTPTCPVVRSQVLTNGRFRSVRHRVMVSSSQPRMSVIFFGGPSPRERLAPLQQLLGDGSRRRYREFTWREYKSSAYRSKLAENRLCHFET